ncbi:MAG: hypothetical protein RLZZ76_121 [Candidatus Parcubacteria bacterium]|jgi:Sec-independent protein translocase protein TatA/uncharacterized protein YheU (UPF0270 family)
MHTVLQKKVRNLGLVLFVFGVTFFSFAPASLAATLSVSPATGVYTAGQTFSVKVVVNTSGAAVNAADGTLKFNPSEVSVVSVSKGSIFSLWTAEPSFSNSAGTISFSGGSPTGYTGAAGTVVTATLRAKTAGSPKVSFSSGSVLAADGRGTNVLTKMNGGAYTISAEASTPEAEVIVEYVPPANTPGAPVITSSTHADSTKWYAVKTAELSWKLPAGVIAMRTLLDGSTVSVPTKVYDSPLSSLTLGDLSEGVQYFHLQFKNTDGWGKVAHYKLAVDTQKPTSFDIALAEGTDVGNPEQTLSLKVVDASSKVKRFTIQLDAQEAYEFIDEQGSGVVKLPKVEPGHHTTIIEAFDEAGNSIVSSFSFDVSAFEKPRFTEFPYEINEQVIPVIKGQTKPKAKVAVSTSKLGLGVSQAQAVTTKEVTANENGEFIFIPDGKLTLGVYELTAFATDEYGARSEVSDAISIAVQQPGYLKVGSMVISFLSVLIPLLSLLVLFVLLVWFGFMRLRSLRRGVSKEAKEAHTMLSDEFAKLKDVIAQERENLLASRKTKKLTKAEEDLLRALDVAMVSSEKRVQKEIVDVESLVE